MADRFPGDQSHEQSNNFNNERQPSNAYHHPQEYNYPGLYTAVDQQYDNRSTTHHPLINQSTNEQFTNSQPARPLSRFVADGSINPTNYIYQQMMTNSHNMSSNQPEYQLPNYGYQSFSRSGSPALHESQASYVPLYQASNFRDNAVSHSFNQSLDQSINRSLSTSFARLDGHLSTQGAQNWVHPINRSGYNTSPPQLISSFPASSATEQSFALHRYNMTVQPALPDEPRVTRPPRQRLVQVLPIQIERIQRAATASIKAVGKHAPVNIAQRMKGTIEVPDSVHRGQGNLSVQITCVQKPQSRQARAPLVNRWHDIRPELDYTFSEMTGFRHLGDDYWNKRINPDRQGIVECDIDIACKQITFTGTIVKRDASWRSPNTFESMTLRIEWWARSGSNNNPECVCAWEQMIELHRRVGE